MSKKQVALVSITPDPELNIVRIARASSNRTDKDENPEGLINYLINNRHWSPFEHSYITMEIKTSRAIGTQLLRHRSFTFQEFSQRYAKVVDIEDIELRIQAKSNRQSSEEIFDDNLEAISYNEDWTNKEYTGSANSLVDSHIRNGKNLYNALLEAGVAKECARMILPLATSTTIYMTGNVRSWLHFLELRDDPHAQLEAQIIARQIKNILIEQLPLISKARGYKM